MGFFFLPIIKTVVFAVNTIVIAVLCSILATQLVNSKGNIMLKNIANASSAKYIGIYLVLVLVYQYFALIKENRVPENILSEFMLEQEFASAVVKKKSLEVLVNNANKHLSNSKNMSELSENFNIFKEMMSNERTDK